MERLIPATESGGGVCESTSPAAKFTSDGSAIAAAISALIGCSFVRRALEENDRGNDDWLELDDIANQPMLSGCARAFNDGRRAGRAAAAIQDHAQRCQDQDQ